MSARPIGTLGRYSLLKEIGHGGMAKVFLARRSGAAQLCVLKQLHMDLELNPTASKRFQREAHIVSHLDHPKIAKVVDAGLEGATFCIAMELIRGQTVEAMLVELSRSERTLPIEMTTTIVLDVLDAAAYAHEAVDQDGEPLNIVHRDLSPRNVMVSFDGDTKVIDFGVAHGRIDGFRTAPGMMVGTLRYMSPEQAMAEKIDARSDIYTIGIVLFEMVTGTPCIADTKAVDVLNRVISEPLPPLRRVAADAPPQFEAIIQRATMKDPEARYQTAREMRDALDEATASVGRASNEAIGNLLRELFPELAAEAASWGYDGDIDGDGEDSQEQPTLSEAAPLHSHSMIPEVRSASTPPRRVDHDAPTADDATPPPRLAPVRSSSRKSSGIRVRQVEEQMRRWRSTALILLVALTAAITALTWLLVQAR